jgi:hypothetical protein
MEQTYRNHSRIVKPYHGLLFILLLAGLIGSIVNLIQSFNSVNLYSSSLILLLFVICLLASLVRQIVPAEGTRQGNKS